MTKVFLFYFAYFSSFAIRDSSNCSSFAMGRPSAKNPFVINYQTFSERIAIELVANYKNLEKIEKLVTKM